MIKNLLEKKLIATNSLGQFLGCSNRITFRDSLEVYFCKLFADFGFIPSIRISMTEYNG